MNSINQSNVEIICCELSNPITDVDDKLMCLISTEKKRKLENIKNLTNRKLSLYGELFVRHYVVSRKNIKNCNIRFEKNEHGKLYLADSQDLYFNISHSQNAVVVAFSRHENGVDIEKIRNIDLNIAKYCFSIEENEYIRNSINQLSSFWEIWTKKEAYLKYVGVGIVQSSYFDVVISSILAMTSLAIVEVMIIPNPVCACPSRIYSSSKIEYK